jgi:hypothetical protein
MLNYEKNKLKEEKQIRYGRNGTLDNAKSFIYKDERV